MANRIVKPCSSGRGHDAGNQKGRSGTFFGYCGWLRNPAPVIRGLHVLTILLVVQDLVHPYVKILSSHLVNQHSDIHHLQKENQWTGHVTVNDLRATLKKMDVHTENLNVPQRFFTNFAVKVAQNCIPKWHGIVRRNHHLSATIQPDLKS
jgi:hypothetical protein